MPTKAWTFELEDGQHRVELDHNYVTGKRTIRLDDGVVAEHGGNIASFLVDVGSQHAFPVGGHTALVTIVSPIGRYAYDLAIDGKSLDTGQPVERMAMPAWVWVFIAAALLAPVLIAAEPALIVIGVYVAFGTVAAARDVLKPVRGRVTATAATAVFWWVLLVVYRLVTGGLRA